MANFITRKQITDLAKNIVNLGSNMSAPIVDELILDFFKECVPNVPVQYKYTVGATVSFEVDVLSTSNDTDDGCVVSHVEEKVKSALDGMEETRQGLGEIIDTVDVLLKSIRISPPERI